MEQNRVLVVYFKQTVAEQVAKKLIGAVDTAGLDSDAAAISDFVQKLDAKRYKYILGLGQYSGRDQDALRLEMICNQKWRNTPLLHFKNRDMVPFMAESKLLKTQVGHGNSYCNLLSLQMRSAYPDTLYNFIHIPKNLDIHLASVELNSQLQDIHQNCA